MKKLFATIMLAASLSLAACGEQSMSSATMKSNLESKGYSAEVMNKTEAEARIKGVEFVVEITDALYSSKNNNEVLIAFFCANSGDATSFMNTNIQALYRFAESYTEEPKVGSYNNVTYAGTASMVTAAGIQL